MKKVYIFIFCIFLFFIVGQFIGVFKIYLSGGWPRVINGYIIEYDCFGYNYLLKEAIVADASDTFVCIGYLRTNYVSNKGVSQ
jgi:hypothetical protein